MLLAANAVAVTGLWWRQGGLSEVHDAAGALTSAARLTGLLGALAALAMLLLLARVPVLAGLPLDRVAAWHRRAGVGCLALLVAHTLLTTAGYALQDRLAPAREASDLLGRYSGVLTATIALGLLIAVTLTSAAAVRRRIGPRAWHAIHLSAYAAVALAFSHQLATGHEFARQPVARAYWWALYAGVAAAIVWVRVARPLTRSLLRHRLHVRAVRAEAPGVVSVEIGGRRLERLGVRPGQFLHWRFLAPGLWWQARPYSLSRAPDGRTLRITVRDRSGRLAGLRPGTRVIAEGPAGGLTGAARRRPRLAMIAGGVGIAPVRALLEELPGEDVTVIYRATRADEVLFRDELDQLGAEVHYVLGDRASEGLLSPARLRALVPDIAERDVFVCGPPSLTRATRASLRAAGVGARQILSEELG